MANSYSTFVFVDGNVKSKEFVSYSKIQDSKIKNVYLTAYSESNKFK